MIAGIAGTMLSASRTLYDVLAGDHMVPRWLRALLIRRQVKTKRRIFDLLDDLRDNQSHLAPLLRRRLGRYPKDDSQVAPTLFGNAIRAAQYPDSPVDELSDVSFWSELHSLLPATLRRELLRSQIGSDFSVAMVMLSMLYAVLELAVMVNEYSRFSTVRWSMGIQVGAAAFLAGMSYQLAIVTAGRWSTIAHDAIRLALSAKAQIGALPSRNTRTEHTRSGVVNSGPSDDSTPPRLVGDAKAALSELDARLAIGASLLSRNVMSSSEFEIFRGEVTAWRDLTYEILRRMFDNSEYADSFHNASTPHMSTTYDPIDVRFQRLHASLGDSVTRLRVIREVIESVLPSSAGRAPARAAARPTSQAQFRDLHIHIPHGQIGQFALGSTVHNIETNINALGRDSDSEMLRGAMEKLTTAVLADESIDDESRRDVIEHLEGLAESAHKPPEERRMSQVRALLAAIPTLLGTATRAMDAWNEHGEAIRKFFGLP